MERPDAPLREAKMLAARKGRPLRRAFTYSAFCSTPVYPPGAARYRRRRCLPCRVGIGVAGAGGATAAIMRAGSGESTGKPVPGSPPKNLTSAIRPPRYRGAGTRSGAQRGNRVRFPE